MTRAEALAALCGLALALVGFGLAVGSWLAVADILAALRRVFPTL